MQQPAMFGPVLSAGLSSRFEAEYIAQMSQRKRELFDSESRTAGESHSNGWHAHDEDEDDFHPPNSTAGQHQQQSRNVRRRGSTEANGLHESGLDGKYRLKENGWATPSGTLKHSHAATTMSVKTYTWVSLWFLITAPIIFWDAGYCFMRPRSMLGGDLHWIWKPYEIYQNVDLVYGIPALERGDGFTNAQSALNIVETFMNLGYLYLAHIAATPVAPLLGFASAVMTLSKTVLYWAQEYYCGGCAVGHNDWKTLFVYWIVPNGFWLVVPTFIIIRLSKDIAQSLRIAGGGGVNGSRVKKE
ncbi:hypothetical protein NLI96_g10515 [Meripilus lineatus]|uniref:EXPERA domain-containing protein n=1 Tax=Meripilus lineatus TaxID=2056292 RepID=A0AAD5YE56_9APHY|nr:hypothetical protein NLI96_g10515 [Physisporinus lineatus]